MKKRHHLVDFLTSVGFVVSTEKATDVHCQHMDRDDDYRCNDYFRAELAFNGKLAESTASTITGALRNALEKFLQETSTK